MIKTQRMKFTVTTYGTPNRYDRRIIAYKESGSIKGDEIESVFFSSVGAIGITLKTGKTLWTDIKEVRCEK